MNKGFDQSKDNSAFALLTVDYTVNTSVSQVLSSIMKAT